MMRRCCTWHMARHDDGWRVPVNRVPNGVQMYFCIVPIIAQCITQPSMSVHWCRRLEAAHLLRPSGKKVTKVIAKKVWTTTRTGTKKYLEKKNRTGGRRPLIIFGITLVTFYPRTTQTVEENGAAEPAQDVVTEETRHGVGHQAIRVE